VVTATDLYGRTFYFLDRKVVHQTLLNHRCENNPTHPKYNFMDKTCIEITNIAKLRMRQIMYSEFIIVFVDLQYLLRKCIQNKTFKS
jgi:hypothetical protein